VRKRPVTDGEAGHCKRTFAYALRRHALSHHGLGMGDDDTLDAARRVVEVALRGVCVPRPAPETGASYRVAVGEEAAELSPNVSSNVAGAEPFGAARNVQPQSLRWTAVTSSAALGALLLTPIIVVIYAGIRRGGSDDGNSDGSIVGNEPDMAPLLNNDDDDSVSNDDDDNYRGGGLMPTVGASNESSGSD